MHKKKKLSAPTMAFYHEDGLPPAWKQAAKFAGEKGRLGVMPDVIAARLGTKPGESPWETYSTTLTAEYYGLSKSGKLLLIVAHGIGPMSTLDGITCAYSWEFKDKSHSHRGGRIEQEEFWKMEAGHYGYVDVIDYEAYCKRYQYPFIQILRTSEALTDPVLKARLGPQAESYILAHSEYARAWHREQAGLDPENRYQQDPDNWARYLDRRRGQHEEAGAENSDPFILKLGDAANCSYLGENCRLPEKGSAFAHLISTGALCHCHHEGHESLTLDIDCHEWWNGVRLIGIKAGNSVISNIHQGPDVRRLLHNHWRDLLMSVAQPLTSIGFRHLVRIGDQWFTDFPKQGASLDTCEPEYVVTSQREVGQPVLFRTEIAGYHGLFKYGIKDVDAIAPPEANAYFFVDDPAVEWNDGSPTHHFAQVQFMCVETDTTKRVMRSNELRHDYDRMMELLAREEEREEA